jgi:hypothetical protein
MPGPNPDGGSGATFDFQLYDPGPGGDGGGDSGGGGGGGGGGATAPAQPVNPYPPGTFEHDLYNDPRGRELDPATFQATVAAQAAGASGSQVEDILSGRSSVSQIAPQAPQRIGNIPGKDFKKPKGVTLSDEITTDEVNKLKKANPGLFAGMTNNQIRNFVRPKYSTPISPPPVITPRSDPGGPGPGGPGPGGPGPEERISPFVSVFAPSSFTSFAAQASSIVKTPERFLSRFQEDITAQSLEKLLFENIGGIELASIIRHDTVEGTNPYYKIISNLSRIKVQLDPITLISRQRSGLTPEDFGRQIALFTKIPLSEYLQDIGALNYIFIDDDDASPTYGNLIIELVNLDGDEFVEVEIATSGTIYEVDI